MINKLTGRSEQDMLDSGWTRTQVNARIEDQTARPWLYSGPQLELSMPDGVSNFGRGEKDDGPELPFANK